MKRAWQATVYRVIKVGHDWSDFTHTRVKTFKMIFKTPCLHVWIRSKYLWSYRWNLIMCSGIKNCYCDPILKILTFHVFKNLRICFSKFMFFKRHTRKDFQVLFKKYLSANNSLQGFCLYSQYTKSQLVLITNIFFCFLTLEIFKLIVGLLL